MRIPVSLPILGVLLSTSSGCLGAAQTEMGQTCVDAPAGHGCLSLRFFVDTSTQARADTLDGLLYWAVYDGGDVNILGPGDDLPVYEGVTDTEIDMSGAGIPHEVFLADVPAGSYHTLAYLDGDRDGENSQGDPTTIPKDAFEVPAGPVTIVDVIFDLVRP